MEGTRLERSWGIVDLSEVSVVCYMNKELVFWCRWVLILVWWHFLLQLIFYKTSVFLNKCPKYFGLVRYIVLKIHTDESYKTLEYHIIKEILLRIGAFSPLDHLGNFVPVGKNEYRSVICATFHKFKVVF